MRSYFLIALLLLLLTNINIHAVPSPVKSFDFKALDAHPTWGKKNLLNKCTISSIEPPHPCVEFTNASISSITHPIPIYSRERYDGKGIHVWLGDYIDEESSRVLEVVIKEIVLYTPQQRYFYEKENQEEFELLRRESRIARMLHGHPNILGYSKARISPDRKGVYVILEFCEKSDLDEIYFGDRDIPNPKSEEYKNIPQGWFQRIEAASDSMSLSSSLSSSLMRRSRFSDVPPLPSSSSSASSPKGAPRHSSSPPSSQIVPTWGSLASSHMNNNDGGETETSKPWPIYSAEELNDHFFCYFYQLVQGIKHMHHHGVVHRDLKLMNVLVNERGVVKIADFGNANDQLADTSTLSSMLGGTVGYFPPEVWRLGSSPTLKSNAEERLERNEYDQRTMDIWAIGIMYYQLRTNSLYGPWGTTNPEYDHLGYSDFEYYANNGLDEFELGSEERAFLEKMLAVNVKDRYVISDIEVDKWFKGNVANSCPAWIMSLYE